jgi:Nif-specific regulatory protein
MRRAVALAARFAATNHPILVAGPTGTGKELMVRRIHELSRRAGSLIDVNCAALPRDLVEGTLFGYRRGAFSGAIESSAGLVAAATNGTLFLDELPSMSLEAQAKLLRLVETQEVRPLGGAAKQRIDFRLVCAAQQDLEEQVRAGLFREDLYYRVSTLRIDLPPLRDRPEDILPLAERFAAILASVLDPCARTLLLDHSWPGNVRELRAVIQRAVLLAGCNRVSHHAVAEALQGNQVGVRKSIARPSLMTQTDSPLLQVCVDQNWDRHRIAAALGISIATLYRRLKQSGISLRGSSPGEQSKIRQA